MLMFNLMLLIVCSVCCRAQNVGLTSRGSDSQEESETQLSKLDVVLSFTLEVCVLH